MEKRLQTILAHAGTASRRHAAQLIEEGRVLVDGQKVTERGYRIDPAKHEILVDGKLLSKEEEKKYFIFNKPVDVISTVKDTHDRKKITDFFKEIDARLYPVGRLDKDTTGFIIVTNDGELANKLAHPRYEIEKVYIAFVKAAVAGGTLKKLENGVFLDGTITAQCRIKFIEKNGTGALYKVKLHEGKKRQIRRMFEIAGTKVMELKRVRYAGLSLGELKEGEYRALTKREIVHLKNILSGKISLKNTKKSTVKYGSK